MKKSGRLLVMGDIHGHFDKMLKVLRLSGYMPATDQLILLGDYVDRGPESSLVAEEVIRLVGEGAVALYGNHEDLMLKALKNRKTQAISADDLESWYANGGEMTLARYNGKSAQLDEHLRFIGNLPRWHEERGYLFVHAGIRPGRPPEQQSPQDLIWIREPYILGYEGPQDVVAGHTPTQYLERYELFPDITDITDFSKPIVHGHKFFLDTGVAWGGSLTIMELPSQKFWQA